MNSPPSPLKAAQLLNHRYKEVLQQDLNSTPEIIHQSNQEPNIEKNNQNITIKSPQGTTLVSATSQGVNSQISLNQIKQINQTLKEEKQQKRVETIAPLLVDYLNLNRTSNISKANFSIEYNSNERTITFENHKNPSEFLKAQLKDDKWLDLGSSISQSEESRFTERVAPKLKKAFLERQHQPTKPTTYSKSQARSL